MNFVHYIYVNNYFNFNILNSFQKGITMKTITDPTAVG